jgi:hypothetical protein
MTTIIIIEKTDVLTACTHKQDFSQDFGLIDFFRTGQVNFSDGKSSYATIQLDELKDIIFKVENKFEKKPDIMPDDLSFLDKVLFDRCNKDDVLYKCHKKIEREQDKSVLGSKENQKSAISPSTLIFQWIKTGQIDHNQFEHLSRKWLQF